MTKTFFLRFSIGLIGLFSISNQGYSAIHGPTLKTAHKNPTAEDTLIHSHNCQEIVAFFEKKHGIPGKLLSAIARVESGKAPWAVNARGRAHHFRTKEKALQFIQTLKDQGVKNINVGYMQINLQSHGRKFKKLEDVLTPYHNIAYAAKLIKHLYDRYGSWAEAIRFYHSGSSYHNLPYQRKVFKAWEQACN
ncbi:transglycosylase SLT domain-containing protein [Candidatus Finniella inopinata]|uniref:Lytic transglycosylase domain-containing protein n=1 Tax=Candidatus Finniella inopinata TaxID=1696036 RepID=A0A4Q7DIV9_9PROT|nr:transglycosylase SLT domain-containing protein [Candidatus Finniella inopinata]RZI46280.1 lytic transglycosylase domain-containing protein [Candidatus Finniella inopinata]